MNYVPIVTNVKPLVVKMIDKEISMLRSAYIHGMKRQTPKKVLDSIFPNRSCR